LRYLYIRDPKFTFLENIFMKTKQLAVTLFITLFFLTNPLAHLAQNTKPEKEISSEIIKQKIKSIIEWRSVFVKYDQDGYKFSQKTYDPKGNCVEEVTYYSNGKIDSKENFKYDEKNKLIEQTRYNIDGTPEEKKTFKYDAKGNEVEKITRAPDGSMKNKVIHAYDAFGNNTLEAEYL
jgi:antitoxin component YwqK of YwqJK toxin-antitoxin module